MNEEISSIVEQESCIYSERKNSDEKERKYERNPSHQMFDSGNKDTIRPDIYQQINKDEEIVIANHAIAYLTLVFGQFSE